MDSEKGGHCAAAPESGARISGVPFALTPVPSPAPFGSLSYHRYGNSTHFTPPTPKPTPRCETVPSEMHGVELGTLNTVRGELQQLSGQKNGMSRKGSPGCLSKLLSCLQVTRVLVKVGNISKKTFWRERTNTEN